MLKKSRVLRIFIILALVVCVFYIIAQKKHKAERLVTKQINAHNQHYPKVQLSYGDLHFNILDFFRHKIVISDVHANLQFFKDNPLIIDEVILPNYVLLDEDGIKDFTVVFKHIHFQSSAQALKTFNQVFFHKDWAPNGEVLEKLDASIFSDMTIVYHSKLKVMEIILETNTSNVREVVKAAIADVEFQNDVAVGEMLIQAIGSGKAMSSSVQLAAKLTKDSSSYAAKLLKQLKESTLTTLVSYSVNYKGYEQGLDPSKFDLIDQHIALEISAGDDVLSSSTQLQETRSPETVKHNLQMFFSAIKQLEKKSSFEKIQNVQLVSHSTQLKNKNLVQVIIKTIADDQKTSVEQVQDQAQAMLDAFLDEMQDVPQAKEFVENLKSYVKSPKQLSVVLQPESPITFSEFDAEYDNCLEKEKQCAQQLKIISRDSALRKDKQVQCTALITQCNVLPWQMAGFSSSVNGA
jgi:hypothetical protein